MARPFTSVNLSSNGNAQFTTTDTNFNNRCLPWTAHDYTIFPYWDDLNLFGSAFGIFTSISGNAPNRIFNIEWRAQYYPGVGTANFELRLYEGQPRFDLIYGTVTNGNTRRRRECRKTTPRLISTSATAQAVRLLADKATFCNLALHPTPTATTYGNGYGYGNSNSHGYSNGNTQRQRQRPQLQLQLQLRQRLLRLVQQLRQRRLRRQRPRLLEHQRPRQRQPQLLQPHRHPALRLRLRDYRAQPI
jgi:hypothetical protein